MVQRIIDQFATETEAEIALGAGINPIQQETRETLVQSLTDTARSLATQNIITREESRQARPQDISNSVTGFYHSVGQNAVVTRDSVGNTYGSASLTNALSVPSQPVLQPTDSDVMIRRISRT